MTRKGWKETDETKKSPPLRVPDRRYGPGKTGIGGRLHFCQYVYGLPRGAETVYCGHPAMSGRSWCETHATFMFTPRKEKKDGETA